MKTPVYQISMRLAIGSIEQAMKDYSDAVTLGRVKLNQGTAYALTRAWVYALDTFEPALLPDDEGGDGR